MFMTVNSLHIEDVLHHFNIFHYVCKKYKSVHKWHMLCTVFPWHVGLFQYLPADNFCLTSHNVLPFVKKQRGDIWVTAGCEVEHQQTPPERLESAKGRDVMMCQPTSHHVWLPAMQRSPARSVYIIGRMRNSNLSQMRFVHWDTMGATYMPDAFLFVRVTVSLRMH